MTDQIPSQRERNARHRLQELINEARSDCAAYGVDLEWDRPDWDITAHVPEMRGKSAKRSVLYFTTHENGTAKSIAGRVPMVEPFASFMKAVIRLIQDARPQSAVAPNKIINASRDLYEILADRGHDPVQLVSGDFDEAVQMIRARTEETTAYRLGRSLETIASWIDKRGISKVTLSWKSPIPRVAHDRTRFAKDNDKHASRMPTDELLEALPLLASRVKKAADPRDVIRMSCVKLLHCGPWRIGEVLTIAADCEVEQDKIDARGEVVVDDGGQPVKRYGIRYRMEKSGQDDIKWMPTAMVDVARAAIAEIREATESAREVARWMEANPGRAKLAGPDHGNRQVYTSVEVAELFGMEGHKAGNQWLRNRDIQAKDGTFAATRGELEQALIDEMIERMPNPAVRPWSDYLFLVFNNLYHVGRATNPSSLALTKDQHISDFLCGRGEGSNRVVSGFERYVVHDASGEPHRMNSHMLRHWLNTLAQMGGVDQAVIARWSGRADIGQNAEYDHVSGTQLAEISRKLMADDKMMGHLADLHRQLEPADREQFRETVIVTAHVTEIGLCLNDWTTSPCPEFGSCAACTECAVTKGDVDSIARTRKLRDDTQWMIEQTLAEIDDGTVDASNHLKGQQDMLAGCDRILAIHADASIADGTLVQPNSAARPHFSGDRLETVA